MFVLGLLFALYLVEGNYPFALFLLTLAYVLARGWQHWTRLNS